MSPGTDMLKLECRSETLLGALRRVSGRDRAEKVVQRGVPSPPLIGGAEDLVTVQAVGAAQVLEDGRSFRPDRVTAPHLG